jgi:hypothetical protein
VAETVILPCNVSIADIQQQHAALQLARQNGSIFLELDGVAPSTPVLQLFLSAHQTLVTQSALAGLGPHATAVLSQVDF